VRTGSSRRKDTYSRSATHISWAMGAGFEYALSGRFRQTFGFGGEQESGEEDNLCTTRRSSALSKSWTYRMTLPAATAQGEIETRMSEGSVSRNNDDLARTRYGFVGPRCSWRSLIHVKLQLYSNVYIWLRLEACQMKTILVPASGSDIDHVVFETALATAQPLNAHIKFLHIHLHAADAALYTPHVGFARGAALRNAMDDLTTRCETRARTAKQNVLAFCRASNIELRDKPCAISAVTAQYRTEEGDALRRMVFHARHHDLVVMGRATKSDGLPHDQLETVLMQSGRPLLIAAGTVPKSLLATVMVCWNETSHAARAVSASLPLLTRAGRVIVASVSEDNGRAAEGVPGIVQELQWHGISASSHIAALDGLSVTERLARIAVECGTTLMVMGGYGRWPAWELVFGGCTRATLQWADVPVFLLH